MEVVKDDFSNLEIGTSVESFQKFLDSQNDLFRSQVDQLQRVVVTQCKLTGANPLSQEMVRFYVYSKFSFEIGHALLYCSICILGGGGKSLDFKFRFC